MCNSDDIVIQRAKQVGDLAEQFVLSNAVMATRKILEDEGLKTFDLANQREKIENSNTISEIDACKCEALKSINKTVNVIVGFSASVAEARTFYSNNYFEIILPKPSQDPISTREIENLRKLLGHELGHLTLHLSELIELQHNMSGTLKIVDPKFEQEAELFAEETIRIRKNHIKRLWG